MAEAKSIITELQAKLEGIRKNSKKREPVELPATLYQQPDAPASQVVQLPLWPATMRGVPNSVLRSALFGAIKRGRRSFMQRVPLASVEGVTVIFTGPQLDQADLDVWEQSLQLARTSGLGTRIQFAAHGFLKAIGRDTGKSQHEWLKGAFARLSSSVVEITEGKKAYFGPMIHHGTRDDETGHYCVEINPAILALYGTTGWSQVEWSERQALRRQPLSQWLHGFYTTHARPYAMKVETLHRLSGSENKELKGFRRELRESLDKLATATGWTWGINHDLVHIGKMPTASQKRHLLRTLE